MTAMPTWWFMYTAGGNSMAFAFCASDLDEATTLAKAHAAAIAPVDVTVSEGLAHEDFEPCGLCPHQVVCRDSNWDCSRRVGEPTEWTFKTASSVHTCPICLERVIDVYSDEDPAPHRKVPDSCPRWNVNFGCAIECSSCRKERDALRHQHPGFDAGMVAIKKILGSVIVGGRAHREGVVDLTAHRERKEGITEFVEATSPRNVLEEAAADPECQPRLSLAYKLLARLWKAASQREEFKAEWERADLDETNQAMLYADLLEGLYLALGRHEGDIAGLTHEWLLVFTDRPVGHRAWARMDVPTCREVMAVWEASIREEMAS